MGSVQQEGAEMADTRIQLRPDEESGKGLWLWVGGAVVVIVGVLAAVLR